MANTLLIEKQNGGYFKFTLNGDTSNAITSIQNDLLAVGNELHFKTGNGANIIKEQSIYPADVTIIAAGTFTFTTVAAVWNKLIDVGYFDWLGGGVGGVDRFDELLDTFQYTGNAGKAVIVDNSELKLVPITLYNKRLFTELEDTPSSLVPDKMVVVNPAGTALILKDQPEPPEEYLNSVGYFDYNDLATQTTPLNATANVALKLTNDTEGVNTSTDQNPYGVSYVWDYATNQFNFSELEVGDTIDVRIHVQVTTTTSNQKVVLSAKFGIGSVSEFTNAIYENTFKSSGLHEISFVAPFYMGSTYITDYPAELYLTTDASGTVIVDGWYIRILRKNINIITVDYQVDDATTTSKGIVRLAGDLAGTANNPTVPELANKVPTSRTVSTTSPLLGGGALSSNLTLSIQQANSVNSGFLTYADWTRFDEAHNDRIVSAAVTGTTTKTLRLNQHDGGFIETNWSDDNSVTSVFGRTGAVVAVSGDYTTSLVTEGSNLYYTEARVSANIDVAANTAKRHDAATLGTSNGLSLSGQVLSLALSNATTTGALSSTDWSTFNNKQNALSGSGIVKSVGGTISYLTDNTANWDDAYNNKITTAAVTGTATKTLTLTQQDGGVVQASWTDKGDDLIFSSPLVNTAGTISIPSATGSVNGYLSSTDWTTFNSKQGALNGTGFVKVSGTTVSYDNNTYALDSAVVKLTGDQTISGIKTFSSQVKSGLLFINEAGGFGNITGYTQLGGTADYFQVINGANSKSTKFIHNGGRSLTMPSSDGTLALTSDIPTISGTSNYISKFTGSSTLGNSSIFDNGTSVGIGTITPSFSSKLEVNGNVLSKNDAFAGFATNVGIKAIGIQTLASGGHYIHTQEDTLEFGTRDAFPLIIKTNANNRLVISAAGASTFYGTVTATSIIKSGGTSSQYLMADGSVSTVNGISGSGTTNYIPKFTGASAIGNSLIYDNGQVNIGSTSFAGDELLMVSMNGTTNTQAINVKDRNASGNGSTFMVFRKSDDTFLGNIRRSGTSDALYVGGNSFLALGVGGNTEAVRINSSGNVGIGTPSPNLKLSVLGANGAPASSGTTQNGVFRLSAGTGLYNVLDFGINETNDYSWIQSTRANNLAVYDKLALQPLGGNVGIGTANPSGQLDIFTSTYQRFAIKYPSAYLTRLEIGGGSYIQQDAGGEELRIAQEYGTGKITFFTGATNTERMRITSGGKVGIGITAPDALVGIFSNNNAVYNPSGYNGGNGRLELGTGNATGAYSGIRFYGNGGSHEAFFGSVQNSSTLAEFVWQTYNGSAYGERMRMSSSGDVSMSDVTSVSSRSLGIPLNDAGWVKLCTIHDNSVIKIIGKVNSNNSEETFTIDINTTYYANQSLISVTRKTYNPLLAEVRVGANSQGVDKIVYARFRTNENPPTVNWHLIGSKGVVAINNTLTTPTESSFNTLTVTGDSVFCTNAYTNQSGVATFTNSVFATGFFNSSDIRLKEIVDYDYSVSDIKPITYLWKDGKDNQKHIGYSAQEVQKVMPDAVNEDSEGMLSVNYVEVLVAKIAELENRIKQLEK